MLTYNVYWRSVAGASAEPEAPLNAACRNDVRACRRNIAAVVRSEPYDFVALQEAPVAMRTVDWGALLGVRDAGRNYAMFAHNSHKDGMITLVDAAKYDCVGRYGGEFEPGRPFLAVHARCRRTGERVVFVNVHLGHDQRDAYVRRVEAAIDAAVSALVRDDEGVDDDEGAGDDEGADGRGRPPARLIVAGDFNRDLDSLELRGRRLHNASPASAREPTCCNTQAVPAGRRRRAERRMPYQSDHVFDTALVARRSRSRSRPRSRRLRVAYPASDHDPVCAELDQSGRPPK